MIGMSEPIYAIGYMRLSDPKQTLGGGGDNQIDAILKYVKDEGYTLYGGKVFQEVFTGSVNSDERPVYQSLLKIIQQNKGKIKYFIIKKIDRSSRAGSQEYLKMKIELRLLGVELRDTERVIQPSHNRLSHRGVGYDWSDTSPSYIAEIILAEIASEDRKNILTRTVDTSVSRIETGYKVREAQYGYQNQRIVGNDGKYRVIQIPYEPEATFIRTIFEDSIAGNLSDKEITEKLNNLGCKTRVRNTWSKDKTTIIGKRDGQSLSVKQMQRWRQNPIYCGVNKEHWGETEKRVIIRKTEYEGLVSIDTFNRANKGKVFIQQKEDNSIKILYNQKPEKIIKQRLKFREDFLFKNVVLCPKCKNPFKASLPTSEHKKRVPYYHCDRGHAYYGIPKADFDKNVNLFLDKIRFSDTHYAMLEKTLIYRFNKKRTELNKGHIQVDEQSIKIRTEIDEIMLAIQKSTNDNARKMFEEKLDKKIIELENIKEEKQNLTITEDELQDFLKELKKLVELPKEILMDVHSYEQQLAINKLFFAELPTYDDIVSGTPKLTIFFKMISTNEVQNGQDVTH
jgi:hypothetical protein